jgi:hypothetical protein
MAGVTITASIEKGGTSVADDLDQMVDDWGYELVVVHGPHACGPCRANENPHNVPCAECHGNLVARAHAGGDNDDPDADDGNLPGGGNLCQCRVQLRKKSGEDFEDHEDL